MTKAMLGMVVSVLAIAEYLDRVYWINATIHLLHSLHSLQK